MEAVNKPHAVMIPWPAQGHINPLIANLLHLRGFHITFVHTEFNYNRLVRTQGPNSVKGLLDFRFETIPDGAPPPSNPDATQDVKLVCDSLRRTGFGPFKELLQRLNAGNVPPVSCVIADGVLNFAIRVAKDGGVLGVSFFTACAFALVGFLHYPELIRRGIFPFKNNDYLTDGTLESPIDWVAGLPNIRLKYLPSYFRTTDPKEFLFHFSYEEAFDCLEADILVFNNFEELEQDAIQTIETKFNYSNSIYSIGPLPLLEQKYVPKCLSESLNSSLWKQDPKVFEWLESRENESVLYVNYGCVSVMSTQHFKELAWGISDGKQPFLWVVRPDIVKDGPTILSEEFLEEIKDRGLLVSWCAQKEVLEHPAVGAFLTHCGWNSMTETICGGKPVICWPFFSDQQTNCHVSRDKWGIGMEINPDVKREDVSSVIQEMMVGEKGKQMRMKTKEWKGLAEKATDVGGSSYHHLHMLIKDIINEKTNEQ